MSFAPIEPLNFSLHQAFSGLSDPRVPGRTVYSSSVLVAIGLLGRGSNGSDRLPE